MTKDKRVTTKGGYIIITPAGHVNACATKSGSWRHFANDGGYPDPITAALSWVHFFGDCVRPGQRRYGKRA